MRSIQYTIDCLRALLLVDSLQFALVSVSYWRVIISHAVYNIAVYNIETLMQTVDIFGDIKVDISCHAIISFCSLIAVILWVIWDERMSPPFP